jgi:hypothetical protein
MNDIIQAPNRGTTEGPYNEDITPGWFTQSIDECPSAIKAHATDMGFTITRSSQEPMPSWTSFNKNASTVNPEQTSVGYLPIIQAPEEATLLMPTKPPLFFPVAFNHYVLCSAET